MFFARHFWMLFVVDSHFSYGELYWFSCFYFLFLLCFRMHILVHWYLFIAADPFIRCSKSNMICVTFHEQVMIWRLNTFNGSQISVWNELWYNIHFYNFIIFINFFLFSIFARYTFFVQFFKHNHNHNINVSIYICISILLLNVHKKCLQKGLFVADTPLSIFYV